MNLDQESIPYPGRLADGSSCAYDGSSSNMKTHTSESNESRSDFVWDESNPTRTSWSNGGRSVHLPRMFMDRVATVEQVQVCWFNRDAPVQDVNNVKICDHCAIAHWPVRICFGCLSSLCNICLGEGDTRCHDCQRTLPVWQGSEQASRQYKDRVCCMDMKC